MADYKSGENTNEEKIRKRLSQEYDKARQNLFNAEASLADVEKKMSPLSLIEGFVKPYYYGVQYSSRDDLENMQKNLEKQIENYKKEKEGKEKAMVDFEKVISGDMKYSELFPNVERDKEYIIMWPEGELGKNRGYGDEVPGNLYLGRIKDYKVQVQGPNGERRDYNFSEGEKNNDEIFSQLVKDTADKYYEGRAKINKGENPQGFGQRILKGYNLTKGRKILNTPLEGETLYTNTGYNSLIQDNLNRKMNRF